MRCFTKLFSFPQQMSLDGYPEMFFVSGDTFLVQKAKAKDISCDIFLILVSNMQISHTLPEKDFSTGIVYCLMYPLRHQSELQSNCMYLNIYIYTHTHNTHTYNQVEERIISIISEDSGYSFIFLQGFKLILGSVSHRPDLFPS